MYYRTIVEESPSNIAIMDVFSKLIQERIIFIDSPITDDLANGVIAQMLYLDSISNKEINIYINTPGGEAYQGLAIYDISQLLKSPIRTVGMGIVASMGAILMLMGEERCGLKNTRFMLHEVSGGGYGSKENIKRNFEEMEVINARLYEIIKEKTNFKNIEETFLFDTWMSSQEAQEYNLITKIL